MLEFPPYDPDRPCRKCGFTLTEDEARPFLISRRCLRCKWSWVERALDYDHEKFLAAQREHHEHFTRLWNDRQEVNSLHPIPAVLVPRENETLAFIRSVMP